MRIWFKMWKETRLVKDFLVEDYSEETRTHKIFNAIEKCSYEFDVAQPIWLENNVRDFKRHAKTRFSSDNFIEDVPFDYLELHVIEED